MGSLLYTGLVVLIWAPLQYRFTQWWTPPITHADLLLAIDRIPAPHCPSRPVVSGPEQTNTFFAAIIGGVVAALIVLVVLRRFGALEYRKGVADPSPPVSAPQKKKSSALAHLAVDAHHWK